MMLCSRLSHQVCKEVLLFHVLVPSAAAQDPHFLATPACLSQMPTRELLVRRWLPERNRSQSADGPFDED